MQADHNLSLPIHKIDDECRKSERFSRCRSVLFDWGLTRLTIRTVQPGIYRIGLSINLLAPVPEEFALVNQIGLLGPLLTVDPERPYLFPY